ncbi:MAG: hypothetical protein KU37_05295 [Sulfuricurvum sp. PC08-66]|nr:MAG: hypothetical protein KU37_05295 [Sulfuricurvum sp. PC08-66]
MTPYSATIHTPRSVMQRSGMLDWDTQPTLYKHYPAHLFSYAIDAVPALAYIGLARSITQKVPHPTGLYHRLSPPSAGNLHPLELYVQLRGFEGVISGIYHIDVYRHRLVLLAEVGAVGLEAHLGIEGRIEGVLWVLSSVPFRSVWKYGQRAWRYLYLDAGHQWGAITAACATQNQSVTILSEVDTRAVGVVMGLGDQERVEMVGYSGHITDKSVAPFSRPLIEVAPTDYIDRTTMREFNTMAHTPPVIASLAPLAPLDNLSQLIVARRSARSFGASMVDEARLAWLVERMRSFDSSVTSHIITDKEGKITMAQLCLGQGWMAKASAIWVQTAPVCDETMLSCASYAVHCVMLEALSRGIVSSGIGAFYDHELQKFLGTQEEILYVSVWGAP